MSDVYADAIVSFESEIDRAVRNAEDAGLTLDEIISELERIAQDWKDSR